MKTGPEAFDHVHLQWFASEEFDKDKFQVYLNTDEGKKWFASFTTALGFKPADAVTKEVEEQVKGLKASQKKWMEEAISFKEAAEQVKRLKDILTEYKIAVDEKGNLDYSGLEEFLHKAKNPGTPDQVGELERSLRKTARDLESRTKELETLQTNLKTEAIKVAEREGFIARLMIDDEFRSALAKNGYTEHVIKTIIPHLKTVSKAAVQMNEENGDRKAVTDDGRVIPEWVSWWKDTDEGKALRLAEASHGGGAGGSGEADESAGGTQTYEQLLDGKFH